MLLVEAYFERMTTLKYIFFSYGFLSSLNLSKRDFFWLAGQLGGNKFFSSINDTWLYRKIKKRLLD